MLDAARARGAALAEDPSADLLTLLEHEGYEPFTDEGGTVRLRNCPFHVLADRHRALTCSMNFALLDGAASAIRESGYRPVAQPRNGLCCVAFEPVSG